MNLVDSSGWIEYFTDGPNADRFAPALEDTEHLLVSVINLYEVFKHVLRHRGEPEALQAVSVMQEARVVPIDEVLALEAARLSVHYRLPMADSLILATARRYGATIWTQDADFEGLEGVRFFPKPGLD